MAETRPASRARWALAKIHEAAYQDGRNAAITQLETALLAGADTEELVRLIVAMRGKNGEANGG